MDVPVPRCSDPDTPAVRQVHVLECFTDREFKFAISSYPFKLKDFTSLLTDVLGADVKHNVYGDFKPVGEVEQPGYYIHVVKKQHLD